MKKTKKTAWYLFLILLIIFIGFMLYKLMLTFAYPTQIPKFFGYSGSIVVSGSMEPTLSSGDMVICKTQDNYEINDIIAFYDEQNDTFVLHRIIGKGAEGFYTQGDYNPECDPIPVKTDFIQGKVVLSFPNMKTYRDILLGAVLALFAEFIVKFMFRCYRAKFKKGGEEADAK